MTQPLAAAEDLFLAALDRPPADRAAFVEAACGGDPAVLGRVRELLTAHQQSRGPLDAPPVGPSTADYSPAADRAGAMVGPYKLLQKLGEGGMGAVWMAEQASPVQRRVAVKVIKPGMDSRQVLARFDAERQALALMDHVNIARVFDAGTTDSGRPYFVMELVHGVPITKYCDDNRLTPRQRLELFVPVCQAVQHAHQKGVIHRDLKPSNVMVTLYDGRPVPKVIDFGVAKATEQKLTEKTLFTQYGSMVGTPEYMSPEQAEMSALGADTRSDIFSLGVLLYELLTGSTPLTAKRLREAAYGEVVRLIREEEAPKPSTRLGDSGESLGSISAQRHMEPAQLMRLVRGELDWIVMKCLEKDRSRRYETASAFAADIQRYLNDEAVQACPPSAGYRLRKFGRRNRGPVLAGLTLAALLVLGTVGTSIGLAWALKAQRAATSAAAAAAEQRQEAETQRDRARTAEQLAIEEAAIAKAVNDFVRNDLLYAAVPEKNARNKKVTVEEVLGRAAGRITGKFEAQPRVEAAIRLTIGAAYRELGNYPAALPHLERSLELRRRAHGDEHLDTRTSMNELAQLYMAQGQPAKAEPLWVQVLEFSRRAQGDEHPDTLAYMNNLAILYHARGQPARAEPLWVRVLEVRGRALGDEHPSTVGSLSNLGALYWTMGEFAKAEPLLVRALDGSRRVHGEENPTTLAIRNNLGGLHQQQGNFGAAERLKVQNLEIGRRVHGEEHPHTLNFVTTLAMLYQAQGRLAKAEPLLVRVLDVSRRVLTDEHPDTLAALTNLASLYRDQGRLAEAEPLYDRALEARRRTLGDGHPHTLYSMNHLAVLYQAQAELAKGERIGREALELARKGQGATLARVADALATLGENLLKQHRYEDAEPLLRECLAIREQKPPVDWKTFHTRSMLGDSLLGQKKYADAEPPLLAGYEGMREREAQIPVPSRIRLAEALERLMQLAEATGQQEQAAAWRTKLEARRAADKEWQKSEQK